MRVYLTYTDALNLKITNKEDVLIAFTENPT